jgi:multimeric flavodoxin WrbA
MKVVAFNGSPRKDGNTTILIKHVFNELGEGDVGKGTLFKSFKDILISIIDYGNEGSCHGKRDWILPGRFTME